MCWRTDTECKPRQVRSGAFTRVFNIKRTWRCGSPSRLVECVTRAVSTSRFPTSTCAPRRPTRATATSERYRETASPWRVSTPSNAEATTGS